MNDKNCTVFDKNWTTGMLMLFLIKQTFWPSLYLYDINLIIQPVSIQLKFDKQT